MCSPITRPHGSPQQAPLQVEGIHNTAQPRKGPETLKCSRKASMGPEMGRGMPLEAEPPVHLRCLLWERSPEESGWRGAGVPPPATSSLATQRRRHDGGEQPQHFLIFLSPSYLGSCPPLSPYLLQHWLILGGGRFTNTAIVAVISRWLGIAMADTSSVSASDKAPYQARSPLSSLSGPPGGGASPDKPPPSSSLGASTL